MQKGLILVSIPVLAVIVTMMALERPVSAYETDDCETDGMTLRWAGQGAFYNTTNHNFPTWWRNEIHSGAAIWNHPDVAADFEFSSHSYSNNTWYRQTIRSITDIGLAIPSIDDETCQLTRVRTLFNTRYDFEICTDCDGGNYDVRTVAAHEFGHWLHLGHVPWWKPWDWDCVMYLWHGSDRTLCNDDIEGIVAIYGAATD